MICNKYFHKINIEWVFEFIIVVIIMNNFINFVLLKYNKYYSNMLIFSIYYFRKYTYTRNSLFTYCSNNMQCTHFSVKYTLYRFYYIPNTLRLTILKLTILQKKRLHTSYKLRRTRLNCMYHNQQSLHWSLQHTNTWKIYNFKYFQKKTRTNSNQKIYFFFSSITKIIS